MGLTTWVVVLVAILGGLTLLVWLAGNLAPAGHVAARRLLLAQPPQAVWDVVRDFAALPQWHPDAQAVERLPEPGREVWREQYRGAPPLLLAVTEEDPPRRLVRTIADENGPFTGSWEYVLEPAEAGCRLTVTERGQIGNPAVRLIFRLFMNPAIYLERYLKALAARLGEPAAPVAEPTQMSV